MGTDAARPRFTDNPKLHYKAKPSVTGNYNFYHMPQLRSESVMIYQHMVKRQAGTHTWTIAAYKHIHIHSGDGVEGEHMPIITSIVI